MDKNDAVINPTYYKGKLVIKREEIEKFINEEGDLSLQYIEVMRFLLTPEEFKGHLKGQIYKYLLRLGGKDKDSQELQKANWYVDYLAKVSE